MVYPEKLSKWTLEDISNTIKNSILTKEKYAGIRVGIAGSYARGENTPSSDIDLVFDTDNLDLSDFAYIEGLFPQITIDILQLPLLLQEDKENDAFLATLGLPENPDSVYKTVIREVIWI